MRKPPPNRPFDNFFSRDEKQKLVNHCEFQSRYPFRLVGRGNEEPHSTGTYEDINRFSIKLQK